MLGLYLIGAMVYAIVGAIAIGTAAEAFGFKPTPINQTVAVCGGALVGVPVLAAVLTFAAVALLAYVAGFVAGVLTGKFKQGYKNARNGDF